MDRKWPKENARRQVSFLFREYLPRVLFEAGSPSSTLPLFFVFTEGFSPSRPIERQVDEITSYLDARKSNDTQSMKALEEEIECYRRENAAFERNIMGMIESGEGIGKIADRISREQVWPCCALVSTQGDLSRELESRYEIGDAETTYSNIETKNGILVYCCILPREWHRHRE